MGLVTMPTANFCMELRLLARHCYTPYLLPWRVCCRIDVDVNMGMAQHALVWEYTGVAPGQLPGPEQDWVEAGQKSILLANTPWHYKLAA